MKGEHKMGLRLRKVVVFFFLLFFFLGCLGYIGYIKTAQKMQQNLTGFSVSQILLQSPPAKPIQIPLPPLKCPTTNLTCPPPPPLPTSNIDGPSPTCPDYFRWIHEDLKPWKTTGITREMVDRANKTANFRLTVVDHKVYIQTYTKSFQSRDMFTIWGIVQLLRRYSGRVPDLDLMFDCVDWPVVQAKNYRQRHGEKEKVAPPPLFRYCGDEQTLDIVFPDWSFWGWPEINIKPWEPFLKELKEGNKKTRWIDREPYAYWKGNPTVAPTRMDLLNCNVSTKADYKARIFTQDWLSESRQGYKQSNLGNQCTYRYKIYIEGSAWSVSNKYILACDSPTLLVTPRYYDFFMRSLEPVHHYWPVNTTDKCRSIRFAVDWGNRHKRKAHDIGKKGSEFIQEKLKMDYVYDYMFHLLNEYSNLLKYKPTIPPKSVEICAESMVCGAQGLEKKFMVESMVNFSQISSPCTLQPPLSNGEMSNLLRRKANSIKQVELWEKKEDEGQNKTT